MDTNYHQQLLEHTGRRIRFYRRLKKLSQDELAAAIHKSESTLSKYERGTIAIDIATLQDIARVLNVSISDLVDFDQPTPLKKAGGAGLFDKSSTLYIYFYHKHKKKFESGVIHLNYSDDGGASAQCRCYLSIPPSGELEECTYYSTGTVNCFDLVSYINITNSTMPMDRMCIYIMNPYARNANAWGLFTGIAYDGSSVFLYKTLISPKPIPVSELDPADFIYSSEDIKLLKAQQMLEFNHPEKNLS